MIRSSPKNPPSVSVMEAASRTCSANVNKGSFLVCKSSPYTTPRIKLTATLQIGIGTALKAIRQYNADCLQSDMIKECIW